MEALNLVKALSSDLIGCQDPLQLGGFYAASNFLTPMLCKKASLPSLKFGSARTRVGL